jgi:hypothetical protein
MFWTKHDALPRFIGLCTTLAMVLLVTGCASTEVPQADLSAPAGGDPMQRYVQICMQDDAIGGDKKAQQNACECWAQTARKRLSDAEMETFISMRGATWKKHSDPNSRRDPNVAAVQAKMKGAAPEAAKCTITRYAG